MAVRDHNNIELTIVDVAPHTYTVTGAPRAQDNRVWNLDRERFGNQRTLFAALLRRHVGVYATRNCQVRTVEELDRVSAGFIAFTDITDWITQRDPEHWWPCDEAAGDILDIGSNTQGANIQFEHHSGTTGSPAEPAPSPQLPERQAGGPDPTTDSIDWGDSTLNWAITGSGGSPEVAIKGGVTGSVVWFFRSTLAVTAGAETILVSELSDRVQAVALGFGGKGRPGAARALSVYLSAATANDNKVWYHDSNLADAGLMDDQWHTVGWTQDGSGPRLYVDGTERTTLTVSQGSPPGDDAWFENNIFPIRSAFANGRWVSRDAEVWHDCERTGPVFVLRNDVMSESDFAVLHALVVQ